MKIKNLILLLSICGCSNIQYKGELKGGDRGAINEVEIVSDLTETVKLKSKVRTPHHYNWAVKSFPDYAETGLEISF